MSSQPIIINAHFQAAAGRENDVGNALQALVAPSRAEPGVLVYELHRDRERPGSFMFYEKFADQAAFDAHMTTPHIQAMQAFVAANATAITTIEATRWQQF